MDYDKDKVDEITLALLYLVTWERQEGLGSRAWKGFDFQGAGYKPSPLGGNVFSIF
jgi:hypothetical protein